MIGPIWAGLGAHGPGLDWADGWRGPGEHCSEDRPGGGAARHSWSAAESAAGGRTAAVKVSVRPAVSPAHSGPVRASRGPTAACEVLIRQASPQTGSAEKQAKHSSKKAGQDIRADKAGRRTN